MKKIIFAGLLILSCSFSFSATPTAKLDPALNKAEEYIKAKNYTAAYKELERIAVTGNADAIFQLAVLTVKGQGTEKSDAKTLILLSDAATKGSKEASLTLGNIYQIGGGGVKPDTQKAKDYYKKASDLGAEDATINLIVLLAQEENKEEFNKEMKRLDPLVAKKNYQAMLMKALYDLDLGYYSNNKKIFNEGLTRLEEVFDAEYIPAIMMFGDILTVGEWGFKQNLPEAKQIFEALVKENIPDAKKRLAKVNKLIEEQQKQTAEK